MTKDGRDILRTLSREQVARLQKLGATVTNTVVTATEEQLWRASIIGGERRLLLLRGQLTISDTNGGGEGDPEWLPSDAVVFADFKNGHYYAGGAETAVSDIFASELANAGVTFNASAITSGFGYESGSQQGGMLTGAAAASLLDGFTTVHSFTVNSIGVDEPNLYWEIFDAPDYTTDWEIFSHFTGASTIRDNAGGGFVPAANVPVLGLNRIAFTVAPGNRLAFSLNGGAVVTTTAIVGAAPNEVWWQFASLAGCFTEAIACYPVAADAALPILSAN